ncbi:MAG: phosphatidylserine decarboxylase [Alphaproteobacteria bacterium]|nr:phosphatidylserine decarboxylase [Alphaproteobacteria bacterium]
MHSLSILCPIHREGYRFIAIFAGVTFLLMLASQALGILGMILTAWCVYFFRDPARVTPVRKGLFIAPADGVVQAIQEVLPPPALEMGGEPMTRISIFMNVFNVHVNRAPIDATVEKLHYHPGAFLNASLDKASEENERQLLKFRLENGKEIAVVQIAGLVARRIVCDVREGQAVKAGERFGIIRFGSRVDVYLPKEIAPMVIVGQTTVGGETVIADLESAESVRLGEVR